MSGGSGRTSGSSSGGHGPVNAKWLEEIASGLHAAAGFDSQSTTSVGFYTSNGTLYITHQANKNFPACLAAKNESVRKALTRSLQEEAEILKPRARTPTHRKFALDECIKKAILDNISSKSAGLDTFMRDRVLQLKTIFDGNISVNSSEHTGLHGESRIIRFLFAKMLFNSRQLLAQALKEKNLSNRISLLEGGFKAYYGKRLTFASSQGACLNGCKPYMDKLGIAYGSLQKIDKGRDDWRHPITLGPQGKKYVAPDYQHITAWVQASLKDREKRGYNVNSEEAGSPSDEPLTRRRMTDIQYAEMASLLSGTVTPITTDAGTFFEHYKPTVAQRRFLTQNGLRSTGTIPNGDCMYAAVIESLGLSCSVLDLREGLSQWAATMRKPVKVIWDLNEAFAYEGPSADEALPFLARFLNVRIFGINALGGEYPLAAPEHLDERTGTIRLVFVNEGTPHYYGTRAG
jgi:hypothetical protein